MSHSARIWNYWLGGKDNFAADREAGDRVAAMLPSIVAQARADRAFLGRAIRYLAGEQGIRQFLDIGTGLPTADNTHEVAQRVAPEARSSPRVVGRGAGDCAATSVTPDTVRRDHLPWDLWRTCSRRGQDASPSSCRFDAGSHPPRPRRPSADR